MDEHVWEYSSARRFCYVSLTKARLSEALKLFRMELFAKEKLSAHIGLHKFPDAVGELDEVVIRAAADGVSLAVIDEETKKLVACQLNKIQVKKNSTKNIFQEINCTHPAVKRYLQLNSKLDSLLDLFEFLHTDCYFEIRFMTILPQFMGKGIERKLMELSLQTAQRLSSDSLKVPVDGKLLSVLPTAVINITSSTLMIEICRDYKYGRVKEISFYNETALSNLIDMRKLPRIPPVLILCKHLTKCVA